MIERSKQQLREQLEAQGWEIVSENGKQWVVAEANAKDVASYINSMTEIHVTAHKDGRQADYCCKY